MQSTRHMLIFLAFLILFYTGFGFIVYWQLSGFAELVEAIHAHPLKVTKGTLTAARNVVRVSRNVKDMLLVNEPAHSRQRLLEIEQDERDTEKNINLVLERIENEEGKVLVRKGIELINEQKKLRERITTEIFSGNHKKGEELAHGEGIALMKELEEAMAKIANYAESRSMAYHIKSVTDLQRAKVVLTCAGLLVLMFSVTFAVVAWRALRKSLQKTRVTLRTAMKEPIDLGVVFDTPSPGDVAEALNAFFRQIYGMVSNLQGQHAQLSHKLSNLSRNSHELPAHFAHVSAKLNAILDKVISLLNVHNNGQKIYELPFDLLKQIKGDLSLFAQIAATKDLLIEKLKTSANKQETSDIIESLRIHSKSMGDNIERTMGSVDGVIELLKSLLERLNELHDTTSSNQDVAKDLQLLKESVVLNDELAQEVQQIVLEMDAILKNFKMSPMRE